MTDINSSDPNIGPGWAGRLLRVMIQGIDRFCRIFEGDDGPPRSPLLNGPMTQRVDLDDLSPVDIRQVIIITTDEGPFLPDCFAWIETDSEGILFSMETPLAEALFDLLNQLADADYMALIQSQSCTENAEFVIWQRD